MTPPDNLFVFNIVWTGTVFDHLKYFVASQLEMCDARFRFITNGCSPEHVASIAAFVERYPDRIVDLVEASSDSMVGHGVCLDRVLDATHDGEFFALIDPDIRVSGPFLEDFASRLVDPCVAITSGRGVWSESDHIPAGHPGVNGEYFYSTDGFLFGSPHFALYRRAAIDAVRDCWGVGFGSSGRRLEKHAAARLAAEGHEYFAYDTGKLMNAFLQFDGHVVEHVEHPALMHIGGMSHYLSPPKYVVDDDGVEQPDWKQFAGMESRFEVAQFTAAVLKRLASGGAAPAVPDGIDPTIAGRLAEVREALCDLIGRYGDAPR